MGATPARTSESDSSDWSTSPLAASQFLEEVSGANHSRWEFNNRKTLLYALVGNDFGADRNRGSMPANHQSARFQ